MFGEEISQFLTKEFIFGFLGGMVVTGVFTWAMISYVLEKMKRTALKTWEKVGCAFFCALIVSLAWGIYNGGIVWSEIPGNVIAYGVFSGFVWDKFVKPRLNKEE